MKITINSQALGTELRVLNKIVPSKPVIPVLSHILFTADSQLQLYATDLEVGLTTPCEARIDEPGTMALPAAKLLSMVERFPDSDMTLATDKQQGRITCGAFRSNMQVLPAEDFPQPSPVEGTAFSIEGSALRWLISKAKHAVSTEASRGILQGALLNVAGSTAALVATDSKRLTLATVAGSGADTKIVIPSKTLDLLEKLLEDSSISITVGERHLFFEVGKRLLTSRTIDGQFPAYERIVPRNNDKVVQLDRVAWTAALQRVVLAAEEHGATWFSISPGSMLMQATSASVGAAEESNAVGYEGEPLEILVNAHYVLDFLEVCAEPTVTMLLKDASSAALLQDGRDCFAVIMLMRA